MRNGIIAMWMLLCSIASASAQVSVGIVTPGLSIGINLPVYPELVRVPGYPVYYAPRMRSNYFFYDGLYWVYERDNWYESSWYNGPWDSVPPDAVPLFVLRIPVRYYREPPVYFRGWRSDAPPRWGEHWGNDWEQHRQGWDNWNRGSVPSAAPLPVYQRQYSGSRYPRVKQQQVLQTQNYRYQPRDAVVQQNVQAPSPQQSPRAPQPGVASQQNRAVSRLPPSRPVAAPASAREPAAQPGIAVQRPAAAQARARQAGPTAPQEVQRAPHAAQQNQPSQRAVSQPRQQPQRQEAPKQKQQAPKPQGPDKGPQGKGPAKDPKQGD